MTVEPDPRKVGLPAAARACLFDLDGVLTQTAKVHAAAWKEMFDEFLGSRSHRSGEPFVPFDSGADYQTYVDGKPRDDGTRAFLASRGIQLPDGDAGDPAGDATVAGLGRRKNDIVLRKIHDTGVEVYPGSVRYLDACRTAGLKVAFVSSSANTRTVLHVTDLDGRVDQVVDAQVAAERKLAGKPAPDTFLAGADLLAVPAAQCAVFEDALAGVAAGHAGHFAVVVGVDRVGHAAALAAHGADLVVQDLSELLGRT